MAATASYPIHPLSYQSQHHAPTAMSKAAAAAREAAPLPTHVVLLKGDSVLIHSMPLGPRVKFQVKRAPRKDHEVPEPYWRYSNKIGLLVSQGEEGIDGDLQTRLTAARAADFSVARVGQARISVRTVWPDGVRNLAQPPAPQICTLVCPSLHSSHKDCCESWEPRSSDAFLVKAIDA